MRLFSVLLPFVLPQILVIATARCDDEATVQQLRAANKSLQTQLDAARRKIKALEAKIATLEAQGKAKASGKVDPFEVGSVWAGTRTYTQTGRSTFQDWRFVVVSRDRRKFSAKIQFDSIDGQHQEVTVNGTAQDSDSGAVRFKTSRVGIFQQSFAGRLAGGQLSLTFVGTGVTGGPVKGTGTLRPSPKP